MPLRRICAESLPRLRTLAMRCGHCSVILTTKDAEMTVPISATMQSLLSGGEHDR